MITSVFVSCTIPFLINTIETNDTFSYIAHKYYALKNMNTKKVYFGLCCEQYWSLFHEWGESLWNHPLRSLAHHNLVPHDSSPFPQFMSCVLDIHTHMPILVCDAQPEQLFVNSVYLLRVYLPRRFSVIWLISVIITTFTIASYSVVVLQLKSQR